MKKITLALLASSWLVSALGMAADAPKPPPADAHAPAIAICPAAIDTSDPICVSDVNYYGQKPSGLMRVQLWTGKEWKYYNVPPMTPYYQPNTYVECPEGTHIAYSTGKVQVTPVTPVTPIIVNPTPVTPIIVNPTPVTPIIVNPTPVTPVVVPVYPVQLRARRWGR